MDFGRNTIITGSPEEQLFFERKNRPPFLDEWNTFMSEANEQFGGVWVGRGCQDSGSCWTIEAIFPESGSKEAGEIHYPSLGCKAWLEFVELENNTAVFRERYYKKSRCVADGWLFLELKSDDTLSFKWAYNNKKDEPSSFTKLSRK